MGDLTTKDIKMKCMKSQNRQNLNMGKILNIQKIDYAPNQQFWSYEKVF